MLKKFTLRNYKNFKNEISIDFENIAGYQFNMDCLYVQIAIQNGHLCHVRRSVCDIIGGQPKTN